MNKGILKKILIILLVITLTYIYFIPNTNITLGSDSGEGCVEIDDVTGIVTFFDKDGNIIKKTDMDGNIIYEKTEEEETEDDETEDEETEDDEEDPGEPQPPPTYSISGNVWEDNKDIVNQYGINKGDGIYQTGENLISEITVNLYNVDNDNNETLISITTTDSVGSYTFDNVEAGKYKVEFVYGNNKNNLKYNGQDYKSSFSYDINVNYQPRDIVLVIDLSGSMSSHLSTIKKAVEDTCTSLLDDYTRISLFTYGTQVYHVCEFSNDLDELKSAISKFRLHGNTNTYGALTEANQYLMASSREEASKFLVIFTDGNPSPSYGDVNKCKTLWNSITENKLAICFGNNNNFVKIFGESGNYVNITDSSNLSDFFLSSVMNFTSDGHSYASDSQERRLEVMDYSTSIDYDKSTILNYENSSNIDDFIENTYMTASTPYIYITNKDVSNINFAIEERPKSSVEITKKVSHLTITLSDGSTLIDWTPTQNVDYLMVLPDSLTAIMDDEITHGANIKIEYTIELYNKGENDNLANYFSEDFLTSAKSSGNYNNWFNMLNSSNISSIVDIIPTQYYIYDYLENNLIFDEVNSPDYWSVNVNNFKITNITSQTILEAPILGTTYILPEKGKRLLLTSSKLMTIADTDLLTYDNYVEVVQYSNVLGRRIYDVTPGNLDIDNDNRELEIDEAKAETVTRVPPFGKDLSYYMTLVGIIILAIEITVLSTLKIKIRHLKNRYIMK